MPNTGTNTDYASLMPDLSDNADIQEALQVYHYGTLDPTEVDSSAFASPSGFGDPDYGLVGKFKWIKTEIDAIKSGAASAIFNSVVDSKGDLIVGTADNTTARLGAGTNGYVLKVDSSDLTYGLKWANLDDTHLNLSGGTLVGNLTITKASGNAILDLQAVSGSTKGLTLKTGSSMRWEILSNSTVESSTATGSDLVINRYNNSGVSLGTVLTITRSSGLATFANAVTVSGTFTASSTISLTGTATFTNAVTAATAPTAGSHLTNKTYVDTSMPVGAMTAYAGSSVPTGWLVCNGQAVSRATYSDLFAVCGTYYGAGDGSTTFNLPDLRTRFVRASDTRGTTGGSSTITTSNMPSHNHGGTTASGNASHDHGGTVWTGGESGHTHDTTFTQRSGVFASGSSGTNAAYYNVPGKSTGASTGHFHGVTIPTDNAAHTHGISSQGSGSAYWQPYYDLVYIIKSTGSVV